MITCTRRIQFCAGHRVLGHEGKCANMHGHNYVLYATAQAPELDKVGRVVDFSVLKKELGNWIDKHWDHGFLYFIEDTAVQNALTMFDISVDQQKKYECVFNPTVENMAMFLLHFVCPQLFTEITIIKIVLWETENCYAEVTF